jgi:hypothetical protein
MVDVTEISAVVAAGGVLVGVALTVLELRSLVKQRQTDLIERLYSIFISEDFMTALVKTMNLEFEDYRGFVNKYGSFSLETPVNVAVRRVVYYYSEAGSLLHRRLVDVEFLYEFMGGVTMIWDKLKPLIEGYREKAGYNFGGWFEYLCNEMKKREQRK